MLGTEAQAFADKYGLDHAAQKELGALLQSYGAETALAAKWAQKIYASPKAKFARFLIKIGLRPIAARMYSGGV